MLRKLGAIYREAAPLVRRWSLVGSPLRPPAALNNLIGLPLGDPLGNDTLSNCVEAASLRLEQVWRSVAWGDPWQPSRADAVARYSAWAGYQPDEPLTDTGTDTARAFSLWCSAGVRLGDQLEDVPTEVVLPVRDANALRLAVERYGGFLCTYQLPADAPDAGVWDVPAPGAEMDGSHEVLIAGYDADGWIALSWGNLVRITPHFHARQCLGASAFVSRLWLRTTGLTPAGLTWAELS
jgi:hypothetical protein